MKKAILFLYIFVNTFVVHAGLFDESVSSILQSTSKELSKSLSIQVDREKILETIVAYKDVLIFKYKITDDSTFKDPRFDPSKYTFYFRKSVGESVCKNESTYALLKCGASYDYVYINQYGQKLFDFILDEKECSNYLAGH